MGGRLVKLAVMGMALALTSACSVLGPEDRALVSQAASSAQRAAEAAERAEQNAKTASDVAQQAVKEARTASERAERMFQRTQVKAATEVANTPTAPVQRGTSRARP
jgi:hypothetical protein